VNETEIHVAWATHGFVILPGYLSDAELAPAVSELDMVSPRADGFHDATDPRHDRFRNDSIIDSLAPLAVQSRGDMEMIMEEASTARTTAHGQRLLMSAAIVVATAAGIVGAIMLVAPTSTGTYFAWPLGPPGLAAHLSAGPPADQQRRGERHRRHPQLPESHGPHRPPQRDGCDGMTHTRSRKDGRDCI
jgi:hypothetical protein